MALSLPTKIEFSRRSSIDDVKFALINADILSQYSLPTMMSNHYSKFKMFDQKILALALRSQVQARDVFDLYLLISSGIERQKLSIESADNILQAIINASTITFSEFNSKVISYLSDEYKDQYSSTEMWNLIVETVVRKLEIYK